MKEEVDHALMLKCLPKEFEGFLDHIASLNYEDTPNYRYLSSIFELCIRKRGIKPNDPLDWEKASFDVSTENQNSLASNNQITGTSVLGYGQYYDETEEARPYDDEPLFLGVGCGRPRIVVPVPHHAQHYEHAGYGRRRKRVRVDHYAVPTRNWGINDQIVCWIL